MHLAFNDEELAFQREVQRFVDERLPSNWEGHMAFIDQDDLFAFTRRFARELGDRGWLTLSWPKEYGGGDAGVWKQALFREIMWAEGEPRGPQYMSLNYIGPSIMQAGTEEQKRKFLPMIAKGDIVFCQGFSEPDAGTDLAALKTRAVRDGDDYVINGEKIWTSYANQADCCYLLARTDPDAPKHKGISIFLVPMETPGVTVRKIRSLKGYGEINSVFFDDVRVPATARLGEENRGWYVAAEALNGERVGVARWAGAKKELDRLVAWTKELLPDGTRPADDPWVRARLAEVEVAFRAARLLNYRTVSKVGAGEDSADDASLARLHSVQLDQKVANVALEVLGHFGAVSDEKDHGRFTAEFDSAWRVSIPATIAAGAIEVQKNLVANRALGIPRG